MNRLKPYFCSFTPSRDNRRARAREVLGFCKVIKRIHQEARDHRERDLEGLKELELWAMDMLQRPE